MDFDEYTSRLGILFLIFAVITSGYVINAGVSCQMQRFLQSTAGSHTVGLLMVFVFLIMEGGMSFDPKVDDQAETNWTRANIVSTVLMSCIIYSLFILSSKMQFVPNLLFYLAMMTVYLLVTHRRFLRDRKKISKKTDATLQKVINGLLVFLFVVGIYGVMDYIRYQKQERGDSFDWVKFFVSHNCRKLAGSDAHAGTLWV